MSGITVSARRYLPSLDTLYFPFGQNALKSAVERVVASAESVDRSAEETGTDFLDVCIRTPHAPSYCDMDFENSG